MKKHYWLALFRLGGWTKWYEIIKDHKGELDEPNCDWAGLEIEVWE